MENRFAAFTAHCCSTELGADGSLTLTAETDVSFAHTDDRAVIAELLSGEYLVVDAEALTDTVVAATFFFWRDGTPVDRPDMTVTLGLFPHLPTRLSLRRDRLGGQQLFLDRTPGRLKGMVRGSGIDPAEVARIGIGITRSEPSARLRISDIWSQDGEPDYPLPETVLVDALGQWATREWPGKTRGLDELERYLRGQVDGSAPAKPHDGLSRWGGFTRRRYDATGFFRVEEDGRYLLVDPDGYGFYSIGLDCVQESIDARVDGIEELFAWLPSADNGFEDLVRTGSGRFPSARSADFLGANLRRALGPQWFEEWARLTETRMLEWRFNTIGNWSSSRFIRSSTLPYVAPLSGELVTGKTIFRDFPDVFSAEYERVSERHAAQLEAFRGDPRLVGYFIVNEPHWAFIDGLSVAEKLLANPEPLSSKDALVAFLSERYAGDARRLAAAWRMPDIESFASLSRPITDAASRSPEARADLEAFTTVLIRRFARIPCEAAKRVDPDHLNLGMRYAWISQPALYETGEYFDVFSINRYGPTAREAVDEIGKRTNRPVMIGEFHHGGLDAGLPSNGIRGVRTQAERAEAYRYFVETTAASRYSVGTHYFTLNDQPVLGRFDGENFQIGIVDICQRPYADFVAGVSATNRALHQVIFGERPPTGHYPQEVTVGF